jgi:hypothetical protein
MTNAALNMTDSVHGGKLLKLALMMQEPFSFMVLP